jgi:hypothetical protein
MRFENTFIGTYFDECVDIISDHLDRVERSKTARVVEGKNRPEEFLHP